MEKVKLTPISALMMQWARDQVDSATYKSFMDHLDLTAGDELVTKISEICDWYDEVIQNKKYFIDNCINEELNKSSDEHLIVILSAGIFPYSLEILETNCKKVNRIIEIDKEGMEEKQELYDRFFPDCADKIKCISADISSKTILDVVSKLIEEYYHNMPCIILLDSATYFLKVADIQNIISSFKSTGKKNTLILDYLRPFSKVNSEKRKIPLNIFNNIKGFTGSGELTLFEHHNLLELFNKIGGTLKKSSDLVTMERDRIGENKHFTRVDDSWLECSVWKI